MDALAGMAKGSGGVGGGRFRVPAGVQPARSYALAGGLARVLALASALVVGGPLSCSGDSRSEGLDVDDAANRAANRAANETGRAGESGRGGGRRGDAHGSGVGDPRGSGVQADGSTPDTTEADELERLQRLGYLGGSQPIQRSGVEVHHEGRAGRGVNLYTSGHGPEAVLIDMQGRELHRWSCDPGRAWPEVAGTIADDYNSFRRARLLPGGELLAIVEGVGLIKLSRDSRVLWAQRNGAHHDLELRPDGDIYLLTREAHVVARVHESVPFLEDSIAVLDAAGKEKCRVSILECIEGAGLRVRLSPGAHRQDPFHTNTVEVLDEAAASAHPALEPGMVLISLRNMNRIAVVDLDAKRVVQAMTGGFRMQHDPTFVAGGRILLFDNLGLGERSRVMEVDFPSGKIHWEFAGSEHDPLFSQLCGTAQRLPNGNTLITESGRGRALEIEPDGTVVWEFFNPHRAGPQGEFIAELFEVLRIEEDDAAAAWLEPREGDE